MPHGVLDEKIDLSGATLADITLRPRYVLQKRLGNGTYGAVYKAFDSKNMSSVSIKVFFDPSRGSVEVNLVKKGIIGLDLNHEHVCCVYELYEQAALFVGQEIRFKVTYVVLELCVGDFYAALVEGPKGIHPFDEGLCRHYFAQLMQGLLYMHERGLFHRDLKPENLLIDHDLNLKIADFGSNKILQLPASFPNRADTGQHGSDGYRPQEMYASQAQGIAYDPEAVDVFGCGAVLFHLVAADIMRSKAELVPYFAPSGFLFPFPHHFPFMDKAPHLQTQGVDGDLRSPAPTNALFWDEWSEVRARISPELLDLFNRLLCFEPHLRIKKSQVFEHPWMRQPRPDAAFIVQSMAARLQTPESFPENSTPIPSIPSKMPQCHDVSLLRRALSNDRTPVYASDMEIWCLTERLILLEQAQIELVNNTQSGCLSRIFRLKAVLQSVIESQTGLSVQRDELLDEGCGAFEFLLACGFQESTPALLELPAVDQLLIEQARMVLDALERAVATSAVDFEEENDVLSDLSRQNSSQVADVVDVMQEMHMGSGDETPFRSYRSSEEGMMDEERSSNGSHGTSEADMRAIDAHLAQINGIAECQMELLRLQDFRASYDEVADWVMLPVGVDLSDASDNYKGATLFCRMSGLLGSWGFYQVVCDTQLATYGNGRGGLSFCARVTMWEQQQFISLVCLRATHVETWEWLLRKLESWLKHDYQAGKVRLSAGHEVLTRKRKAV